MDGVFTKAPLGGKTQDQIPHTDRSKSGTKRSILIDGKGLPLSLSVDDGANRHDMKMSKAILQSIVVIYRPEPTIRSKQHIWLDRVTTFRQIYGIVEEYGYTIRIPLGGEKRRRSKAIPGYRTRHWVVERTHSWMNRFRRLLIRWEKKIENHIAMLHYACARITYRRARVFG